MASAIKQEPQAAGDTTSAAAAASSYPLPPRVQWRGGEWLLLESDPRELRLDITLHNGQAFGWIRLDQPLKQEGESQPASKGRKRARSTRAAESESNVKAEEEQPAPQVIDSGVNVKSEPMDETSSESPPAPPLPSSGPLPPPSPPSVFSPADPLYACVLFGGSLVGVRQSASSGIYYTLYGDAGDSTRLTPQQLDARMRDYFQLPPRVDPALLQPSGLLPHPPSPHVHSTFSLASLYDRWSGASGARFRLLSRAFPGVRVLRQDPVECLFSFLCSSNNHIARITAMLARLRTEKGREMQLSDEAKARLTADGVAERRWLAFPSLAALAELTEAQLREWGFGYRAKYLVGSAAMLQAKESGGESWLLSLRSLPRAEAEAALVALPGIGPKVAGCIALFSLDHLDCVPVDTHVWNLARRDFAAESRAAGLDLTKLAAFTPRAGAHVADLLRGLFAPHAGWAHSILFVAELKQYEAVLRQAAAEEAKEQQQQQSDVKLLLASAAAAEVIMKIEGEEEETAVAPKSESAESLADDQSKASSKKQKKKQKLAAPASSTDASGAGAQLSRAFTQRKNK